MIHAAITGSQGLVGSRIVELLKDDISFIPLTQQSVDITNTDSVWSAVKDIQFDVLLHLAAYTNVDGAEKERDLAYKINVEGTKNMFEVTKQKGAKFIYVSTDFVFDGTNPPYTEESKPNPPGYYGETKYLGEQIVGRDGMIVRIAYPYRAHYDQKKDYVRTLKTLLEKNTPLSMISDSLITPTFIDDIAFGLRYLMENFAPHIYHLVGKTSLSPYASALAIADTFGLDKTLISQTTFAQYFKDNVIRPKLSEIHSITNTFYPMKTFEEGLRAIL